MTKNVLVIYYSQTGQLGRIIDEFCKPLQADYNLELVNISPKMAFEFPWSGKDFFRAMPMSALGETVELEDFSFQRSQYDLVIFGYQPWFLSPSVPATSMLKHPKVKAVMKDAPVITVIGSRNMWLNSQEKIKVLLRDASANLVGNVAFADRHHNWASAVSIVYWQLYGKKRRLWGIFPKPGVSEKDISSASKFGHLAQSHIESDDWNDYQQEVIDNGGVEVKPDIMFIESKAGRLFSIWANFIGKKKNRDSWLVVFKYYLAIALFVASPFVVLLDMLLIRPFTHKKRNSKRRYFQSIELNGKND
ncbi:hypothetical protein [Owenweeksia hongkongensis]|uniref:hypothetical protein n=1 Tax=Owenweeksia hongkongensis TaxID=253245 RepID=UPI003A948A84